MSDDMSNQANDDRHNQDNDDGVPFTDDYLSDQFVRNDDPDKGDRKGST